MASYESEGTNRSFKDPTQTDDIYHPPPGFDSPPNKPDRYRPYGGKSNGERSAQRPNPDTNSPGMNDEYKRRASVTKRIWSILKGTFLCACPLFIIGLVLVVLGVVDVPAGNDLIKPGAPILIIAMVFLIITIILLVVYKVRGMNAYDIGQNRMTGIVNNGVNVTTQRSSNEENRHERNEDSEDRRYNESRRI
nr:uncharacterized protein LOC129270597 [Lytechinus pictus]